MFMKTIAFEDFNGDAQTETFYFNLTKGELVEMELRATNSSILGMADLVDTITKTRDGNKLADLFKDMVGRSYGIKSLDGKRFIKTPENLAEFVSTGAYGELIFELATDAEAAALFTNGLMPANIAKQVKEEVAAAQTARERSEASLQGYQKKQAPEKIETVTVPEFQASEPVLEPTAAPAPAVDPTTLTHEQLLEMVQRNNIGAGTLK